MRFQRPRPLKARETDERLTQQKIGADPSCRGVQSLTTVEVKGSIPYFKVKKVVSKRRADLWQFQGCTRNEQKNFETYPAKKALNHPRT